ncbi:LOW QUALITY PROTEIN: hypothetical protein KUTeg_010151 [Tegillarca granosa]|uniref:Uncharacterized protein n=1 Tax=Tegillarca granosa TaxID=220873 RepID=A0ABQ9FAW0_TEGGR|nr:LOW QUALITY PROTEIN: hypothetical protein KUTeg_010151 [Tegillarca granosa]
MFEALEKNDLSQLNKMHKETLQNLQERRVRYENRAKILEQCHASLDNNLKHLHRFTNIIKRQLTEQEQYIISVADTVDQQYQYKFTISPSISNMASILTTYGDITRCSKIRQLVLANTFKVDLQNSAHFSDGVYFCNQKIILTVSGAPELLVYDITGARHSVIKLGQYGSWFGLTLIKNNLYAVSRFDSSCITFIDIVNQKVQKSMDISNLKARRLASSKNKIIVASVSDIKILDHDGNLSKSLRSPSGEIFGVCVTKNDNVIYTDRKTDELYCIDMNVLFTYSDKSLKCPTDVKADDDGNIYVVGRMSHNIHMLSPEGKFIKMFLSEKDGIHRPYFLSFNKDFSQVMICCDMDDSFPLNGGLYIKLFDMIQL